MTTKTITMYIAEDGKEFVSESECRNYEKSWFELYDEYGHPVMSKDFVAFAIGGTKGAEMFKEYCSNNEIELCGYCDNDHIVFDEEVGVWFYDENHESWVELGGKEFNHGAISNIVAMTSHYEF